MPLPNCSLTTQYDYASDHGIKLLVVLTEAGLLQTNSVEVTIYEIQYKMTAYVHEIKIPDAPLPGALEHMCA